MPEEAAKVFPAGWTRDSVIVIPVLGSAMAVSYDVGFFLGIDINYFTFFSLAEHIVFALQALPFALLGAFYCLCNLTVYNLGYKAGQKRAQNQSLLGDRAASPANAVRALRRAAKIADRSFEFAIKLFLFEIFIILALGLSVYRNNFSNELLLSLSFLAIFTVRLVSSNYFNQLERILYVSVFMFALSIFFGWIQSRHNLSFTQATSVMSTESGEILGRLIRSGDRGLLYLDVNNQNVVFYKWDTIKSVRSTR
jgi:hypothetical protein